MKSYHRWVISCKPKENGCCISSRYESHRSTLYHNTEYRSILHPEGKACPNPFPFPKSEPLPSSGHAEEKPRRSGGLSVSDAARPPKRSETSPLTYKPYLIGGLTLKDLKKLIGEHFEDLLK